MYDMYLSIYIYKIYVFSCGNVTVTEGNLYNLDLTLSLHYTAVQSLTCVFNQPSSSYSYTGDRYRPGPLEKSSPSMV